LKNAMAGRQARVLIVEDTVSMARLFEAYLGKDNHQLVTVETGADALAELDRNPPDAIVLDLKLPDMNGLRVLERVIEAELPTSVVVVTTDGSLKVAVEAMRLGAYDFVVKPVSADRLRTTVKNALERLELRTEVTELKETFARDQLVGLIGGSLPMQAVYRMLHAAARSSAPVFITGESGTGKELAAEAVHKLGQRRLKPLIALNCGAMPKDLVESEIFGHVKGSFTGATSDRIGAARQADGGTLFLDEICEMQIDLQSKLLRFLQTGTVQPVGANKPEKVDVRIVCATNRDPAAEVAAGRFREDLYYRLHVLPVHMPPLRERDADVLLIARAFLREFSRDEGRRFQDFDADAEAALLAYPWPGNVRQLQNVLRQAVVMHDDELIRADMLSLNTIAPSRDEPALALRGQARPVAASGSIDAAGWSAEADIVPLAQVERSTIERAIEICGGNIPRAAAFLGVSASTLYRKKQSWT
jgi:DNA-binding NtrC family response regulator